MARRGRANRSVSIHQMRVRCPNCGAKLILDPAEFDAGPPQQVKCWMCTRTVILDSSSGGAGAPTIVGTQSKAKSYGSRVEGDLNRETTTLSLPRDTVINISVVAGLSQGIKYELSRPLLTIGRLGGGADIQIDDSEVSRLHCSVEAKRDAIVLRDLHSSNGTYLGDSPIFAAQLENMSQFRIGSSVLQVTILPAAGAPRSPKDTA